MNEAIVLQVSDFVSLLNQTLEYVYPHVRIVGELANFKVSKNKWVYFDLKDEFSSVRFFGTVYSLPGPLEDGMMLEVGASPRHHPQFGFSLSVQTIQPVGEGTIKKAATLLAAKLEAEGLFDPARKRSLPYPPRTIGLITSSESAAYADFIKVLKARWAGLEIEIADVHVQGERAPTQIVGALKHFNERVEQPQVLVVIRGGGSPEDLAAFSSEQVTRAISSSRIPTLVAIGHETDISLAELAADMRASTPSNAAELLVPDKHDEKIRLQTAGKQLERSLSVVFADKKASLEQGQRLIDRSLTHYLRAANDHLTGQLQLLKALSPESALRRGYAILRSGKAVVSSGKQVKPHDEVTADLADACLHLRVESVELQ